jgi:hypothetical protein
MKNCFIQQEKSGIGRQINDRPHLLKMKNIGTKSNSFLSHNYPDPLPAKEYITVSGIRRINIMCAVFEEHIKCPDR